MRFRLQPSLFRGAQRREEIQAAVYKQPFRRSGNQKRAKPRTIYLFDVPSPNVLANSVTCATSSIGTGNTIVDALSPAIEFSVCR
jgi:hypothetical protein